MPKNIFINLYKSLVRRTTPGICQRSVWYLTKKTMLKPSRKCKKGNQASYFIKTLSYTDRLVHLGLPTLKYRRSCGNMIEVFKKHIVIIKLHLNWFTTSINNVTRGNDFRLLKNRSHYNLRKFSFINKIVDIWNSPPNAVVNVNSVEVFKSRLDNFWKFQDVKIDYTADLTGTGNQFEFDT